MSPFSSLDPATRSPGKAATPPAGRAVYASVNGHAQAIVIAQSAATAAKPAAANVRS